MNKPIVTKDEKIQNHPRARSATLHFTELQEIAIQGKSPIVIALNIFSRDSMIHLGEFFYAASNLS